ncbi:hypothetical protein [Mucilaginibacter lacusdianchii]|uniref:hypothetical protein n=1 Tax=Mucilaginibacter lacusdianchii TaxID=2684211 RepID=UPI0018EEE4A3|nr:hypothetical protein [Mucilaginibacter sp. JXJ CY 39]
MTTQPIIKVNNLYKQYGDFKAVSGISFDVYEGEYFLAYTGLKRCDSPVINFVSVGNCHLCGSHKNF